MVRVAARAGAPTTTVPTRISPVSSTRIVPSRSLIPPPLQSLRTTMPPLVARSSSLRTLLLEMWKDLLTEQSRHPEAVGTFREEFQMVDSGGQHPLDARAK